MVVQVLVPLIAAAVIGTLAWAVGENLAGWRAGYLPERQESKKVPTTGAQLGLVAFWMVLAQVILQLVLLIVITYLPSVTYPLRWYVWFYLVWVVVAGLITWGAFWRGYYGWSEEGDTKS